MKNKLSKLIKNFQGKRILVVGDVMLDKYVHGRVNRVSPEAPVPIVKVDKEYYELGGTANVAANVSSLGGQAVLFGFVGEDENGKKIRELLENGDIDYYFDEHSETILKERIIARSQQSIRIDYEDKEDKQLSGEGKKKLAKESEKADMIVVSDYAKGAITEEVMKCLHKNKTIVDPKPENSELYKGVYLISPNEKEAVEMSGRMSQKSKNNEIGEVGDYMKNSLDCNLLVTRGDKGMVLFSDQNLNIPTYAREVYDITGAGDTVKATLSLCLAAGSSLQEAAIMANHAASIVVSRAGTYQVKINELKNKIVREEKKIKSLGELKEEVKDLKRKGKKIVWTNGCFDLLHEAHVKYLNKAKEEGDYLIVGLNSDQSIKEIKGENRPVRPEKARAEIISSLESVDDVIIFGEKDVIKYLIELDSPIPSQYMRKLIAKKLGIPEKWDWRKHPQQEKFNKTIKDLKKHF